MALVHAPAIRAVLVSLALMIATARPEAIKWTQFETSAHAFPALRDAASGRLLGDGTFRQWIENGALRVVITYAGRDRVIEERVVLTQRPELAQDSWSLTERNGKRIVRQFQVDFRSGRATALTYDEGKPKRETETLQISRGETFAGFGFTLAIKALRQRLLAGEHVTLRAVGFSPQPQTVDVELSYAGRDRVRIGNRRIPGDRFVVHPKIPVIAKLFVHVPDATIWLTTPPAGFLRWEGPLAEPDDAIVRVDLMSG